jgi:hypothetical protein
MCDLREVVRLLLAQLRQALSCAKYELMDF